RRWHTRSKRDWSSDVCSSDLVLMFVIIRLISLFRDPHQLIRENLARFHHRVHDSFLAFSFSYVVLFLKRLLLFLMAFDHSSQKLPVFCSFPVVSLLQQMYSSYYSSYTFPSSEIGRASC